MTSRLTSDPENHLHPAPPQHPYYHSLPPLSQEVRYEDSRGDQCLDLHREASPIITLFPLRSAE